MRGGGIQPMTQQQPTTQCFVCFFWVSSTKENLHSFQINSTVWAVDSQNIIFQLLTHKTTQKKIMTTNSFYKDPWNKTKNGSVKQKQSIESSFPSVSRQHGSHLQQNNGVKNKKGGVIRETLSPSATICLLCFRGSVNTFILINNDALYNLLYFCFA